MFTPAIAVLADVQIPATLKCGTSALTCQCVINEIAHAAKLYNIVQAQLPKPVQTSEKVDDIVKSARI